MWIVIGVLALPLVEIGLFVTLGAKLGLWLTLAWVILTAVLGVLLLKGMAEAGRQNLRQGLREGIDDPLSPIAHQALIGMAAVLLILPGFFTDAMGLLLLIRPVRTLIIRLLGRRMGGVAIIRRGPPYDDRPFEHQPYDDRLN